MPEPPEISRYCSSLAAVQTGKLQLAHFSQGILDTESASTRIMHGIQERNAKEIIASICIAYPLDLRRKHHKLLDKYMIDTHFGFVDRGIGGGPPP
jgi:hypothetical protein